MELLYASYLSYCVMQMAIVEMMKTVDSEYLLKKEPIGWMREAVWLLGSTLAIRKMNMNNGGNIESTLKSLVNIVWLIQMKIIK